MNGSKKKKNKNLLTVSYGNRKMTGHLNVVVKQNAHRLVASKSRYESGGSSLRPSRNDAREISFFFTGSLFFFC